MKKLKILTMTLMTIVFAILFTIMINNVSFAAYEGLEGISQIKDADPEQILLNDYMIKLGFKDLQDSDNLYCMENHQRNLTPRYDYKVLVYMEINGEDAVMKWIHSDGRLIDKVNSNKYNAILAEILSGKYGLGYGVGKDGYTQAQKGLYTFFTEWIENSGKPQVNESWYTSNQWVGDDIGDLVVNNAKAAVEAGARSCVRLYLLDNWQDTNWQRLMIAFPGESTNAELSIDKVDEEDNTPLKAVKFTIRNSDNQYLVASAPTPDNTYNLVAYTDDPSQATEFSTGISTYQTIKLLGVPQGRYVIREISNPNTGYNIPSNIGKEQTILLETNSSARVTITNNKPERIEPQYDGYIKISGKVWVDGAAGKANDINGIYNGNEQVLQGIKVTLRDKYGNEFTGGSTAWTDGAGNYTITVNYDTSNSVYKLYEPYSTVKNKLNDGAYVEFTYNGVKYTTVQNSSVGENTSKAVENVSSRSNIDNGYTRVDPSVTALQYGEVTADTRVNILSFNTYPHQTTGTDTVSVDHCNGNWTHTYTDTQNSHIIHENVSYNEHHKMKDGYDYEYWTWPTDTNKNGIIDPAEQANVRKVTTTDEPNEQYRQQYNEVQIDDDSEDEYCDDWRHGHSIESKSITYLHITNVNLGLYEREQPNLAIFADMSQVEVVMKGQKYTYLYGIKDTNNHNVGLKVKFQTKSTYVYRRAVNPADIAYVNDMGTNDLEVYVTYKIRVANLSTTLQARVHNLVNSYDSEYTIVSSGWGTAVDKGHFKESVSTGDLNITMAPGTESAPIEIKYKVSQNAIKGLLNEDATLNNAIEIHTYSTQYGTDTLYAELGVGGRTGNNYAGYDYDSQPGNANIVYNASKDRLEATNLQDDTDIAPSFVLEQDKGYKILSGNVWEDTDTGSQTGKENERIGDGKKSNSEKNVANVKVELLKVILNSQGAIVGSEVANLYRIDLNTGIVQKRPAETYTDSNGNYAFGSNTNNIKEGVVTDNYIMKFTYGNGTKTYTDINGNQIQIAPTTIDGTTVINARNYKSTIIREMKDDGVTQNPIYSVMQGENNTKWYENIDASYSIAVDNLNERLNTPSLIYSNFDTPMNMSAYSKMFTAQIEYTIGIHEYQVNKDGYPIDENGNVINGGQGFSKQCSKFGFGIIERPREDIIVDKYIENIKITLANGQILVEGNPRAEKLDYVKALGLRNAYQSRNDTINTREKLLSIEMDSELIQGAQLDILYAITVINNSEIDYEYEANYTDIIQDINYITSNDQANYYYYGKSNGLNKVSDTVELVVEYLDPELNCTVGNEATVECNKVWFSKYQGENLIEKLKDTGYISLATYNKVKADGLQVFATEAFVNVACGGGSQTERLYATKLLANKEDEHLYQNHAEILRLNGKGARTISETVDGRVVTKTYKSGDYVPSLSTRQFNTNITLEQPGLHEQDDDMVKIVITPPTGMAAYTTMYIIAGVIGLIILVGGIILIKKKVIGK